MAAWYRISITFVFIQYYYSLFMEVYKIWIWTGKQETKLNKGHSDTLGGKKTFNDKSCTITWTITPTEWFFLWNRNCLNAWNCHNASVYNSMWGKKVLLPPSAFILTSSSQKLFVSLKLRKSKDWCAVVSNCDLHCVLSAFWGRFLISLGTPLMSWSGQNNPISDLLTYFYPTSFSLYVESLDFFDKIMTSWFDFSIIFSLSFFYHFFEDQDFYSAHLTEWAESISGIGLCVCVCMSVIPSKIVQSVLQGRVYHRFGIFLIHIISCPTVSFCLSFFKIS